MKANTRLFRNYMNDSLRTDVFVRYSPETIACACIYLSSRKLNIPLPKKPAWYLLFGCTELQLKDICIRLMKLYSRPKPDGEKLEQVVAKLRDAYHESRLKLRLTTETEATQVKQQLPHSPAVGAAQTAAVTDGKAASVTSATSTPALAKGDDKNHSGVKRSRTRTRSRSRSRSHSDKHRKSRHHRKKRSKSRSRSRSRSHEKRRDRDRDRRKRSSRDRERDYKHRKEKERERDRRSRRDRSLSRDRRR